MRIGLIRRKYDLSGGAELSLRLLVEAFLKEKHQVAVLAESWQGAPPAGMEFHPVVAGRGAGGYRLFARRALAQAQSLALDTCLSLERVPHIPFFRAGDGCHRAWLERRAPYESWLKQHTFYFNPRHRTILKLEEEMFSSSALRKIIANSRMVADEITSYYGVDREKIEVIYNPVDSARTREAYDEKKICALRKELGILGSEPVLLFLGTGFERKGLAFMIKALALLPDARLLVAGQGKINAYQKLAAGLNVLGRVNFLGLRQDAGALLGLCHALVLPTIYDPCANVCLEALAAGKPVVTTYSNGAHEFIEQGKNGSIVESPADTPLLAKACAKALQITTPVYASLNTMDNWLRQIKGVMEVA